MADFNPNDAYLLISDATDETARVISLTTGQTFEVTDQQLAEIDEIYIRPLAGSRAP